GSRASSRCCSRACGFAGPRAAARARPERNLKSRAALEAGARPCASRRLAWLRCQRFYASVGDGMRPTREQLAAVRAELKGFVLKDDADAMAPYGHDESDTADFQPDLVVLARDRGDVQRVFRACLLHKVPVTPVGAR